MGSHFNFLHDKGLALALAVAVAVAVSLSVNNEDLDILYLVNEIPLVPRNIIFLLWLH